jgi:serralysin
MTDTVIVLDGEDDLTPGQDARHEMAATLTGTTHLALTLTSTTLGGIKALGTQRIIVGSGFGIDTQLAAIALSGAASSVQNDGSIKSHAASAILFSGAGGSVDNKGTIEATGSNAAILGSTAADRIINTGTIKAAAAGGVALDLKEGDDLYDGRSTGSVTGTVIGTIRLGSGNDIAYGGSGAETFSAGTDTNVIDGGTGTDTIDYSAAPVGTDGKGVMVNLATSTSQWTNYSWDTLLEIENVIGSAFSDTLTGSSDKNTLMGGAGDDTLDGGFDDDVIDGGDGDNTAKFSSSTAATVDLSNTAAQETGYGKDIFTNIRHLEGGSGADKFTGNGETNRLTGNSGNDTLNGAAGNDSLQGGADVDRLQGDSGDDTLEGGAGNDELQGGTGRNTAVFSGNRAEYDIAPNAAGGLTVTDRLGRDGADTLNDVRFAKFADQTIALTNRAPSTISPSIAPINVSESAAVGARVTTLFSSDPDGDTLNFSLVSDAGGLFRLNGTQLILNRALDYETATQHTISVKASDGYGGEVITPLTINVGNSSSETAPLVKSGSKASEQVVGENGNDQLRGQGGNDQVFGQGGNDKLWGGAGNDTLVGGAGSDIFVFDVKPHVRSNLDYVYDFNVRDDTIHLSKKIFSKIAKKGTLSKGAFVVGDRFKDADDRILYHKKAGALFYDPDGSGAAKAVQFATLDKKLAISHKDFLIY